MKYKILSWETGLTKEDEQCIVASVLCSPNWFARTFFKASPIVVDCYGEATPCWSWYHAHTGKPIEETTYANYDDWGAGGRLGDFLNTYRRHTSRKKSS
jgi:hypothetical protein